MGSDSRNAVATAASRGGYWRRSAESKLLSPEPHALEPGVGLLKAPAVIGLENIGDRKHHIKGATVISTAADHAALQGIGELQEVELRKPVALFKGSKGVVLLIRQGAGL